VLGLVWHTCIVILDVFLEISTDHQSADVLHPYRTMLHASLSNDSIQFFNFQVFFLQFGVMANSLLLKLAFEAEDLIF